MRLLAILAAMILLVACIPAAVFAEETEIVASGSCGGNLTWTLTSDGTLTISGTGCMEYSSAKSIPWYEYREQIRAAVIESGVMRIGSLAFNGCSSLASVTIPESVTSIVGRAFSGCSSLTAIITSEQNPNYCTIDGVLFNKDATTLAIFPEGKGGSYAIPDGVTSIGGTAFFDCSSLISVTIPDSVTSINWGAFDCCSSLTEIRLLGDAPEITDSFLERVLATAYYPADNATWTEEMRQNYGGEITWQPYGGYAVLDGEDAEWVKGDPAPEIHADGALADCTGAYLDGELVDPENYDLIEGSTIVRFHEDFLASLSDGEHIVRIHFTDGTAETTITVKSEPTEPKPTEPAPTEPEPTEPAESGDTALLLPVALLLASALGIVAIAYKRRTRYPRAFGTSVTTGFGNFIQRLCNELRQSYPSTTVGMDIEFVDAKDGRRKYCQLKAGPNTINKDDVKTIKDHFRGAIHLARTNGQAIASMDCMVGVCYGTRDDLSSFYKAIDEDYPVFIGDEFWTRLTGDDHFYEDLINAFAEVAADINAANMVEDTVQKLASDIGETTEE